jgi:hypothetical protein
LLTLTVSHVFAIGALEPSPPLSGAPPPCPSRTRSLAPASADAAPGALLAAPVPAVGAAEATNLGHKWKKWQH